MESDQLKCADDNNNQWRSHFYRRAVARKIEETIRETGVQIRSSVDSNEIENFVYTKVNARHEYMITISQLILALRKKALQQQSQAQSSGNSVNSVDLTDLAEAIDSLKNLVL